MILLTTKTAQVAVKLCARKITTLLTSITFFQSCQLKWADKAGVKVPFSNFN
jgi:hypothetical protein